MSARDFFHELRLGLRKTSEYLLSHHEPQEYFECYTITCQSRRHHICARCTGIYAGILLGFCLHHLGVIDAEYYYVAVILLPPFSMFDWSITAFTTYKSSNLLRSASGMLLGIAYALGLVLMMQHFPSVSVLAIGAIYASIAFVLLVVRARFKAKRQTSIY